MQIEVGEKYLILSTVDQQQKLVIVEAVEPSQKTAGDYWTVKFESGAEYQAYTGELIEIPSELAYLGEVETLPMFLHENMCEASYEQDGREIKMAVSHNIGAGVSVKNTNTTQKALVIGYKDLFNYGIARGINSGPDWESGKKGDS